MSLNVLWLDLFIFGIATVMIPKKVGTVDRSPSHFFGAASSNSEAKLVNIHKTTNKRVCLKMGESNYNPTQPK